MGMKTSDFYFDLPKELIAQDPLEDRSSSKLLMVTTFSDPISPIRSLLIKFGSKISMKLSSAFPINTLLPPQAR